MSKIRSYFHALTMGLIVTFLVSCAGRYTEHVDKHQGIPIIFDTDIGTDIDDAGALAILHVMADRGQARILATILSLIHI